MGNFPGITVDILQSPVRISTLENKPIQVDFVDLPGVYSLTSNTKKGTDESVARDFLSQHQESMVALAIIDATQAALALNLVREVAQLGVPTLIVVTQKDAATKQGITIDIEAIERVFGTKAIAVSARDTSAKQDVFAHVSKMLAGAETYIPHAPSEGDLATLRKSVARSDSESAGNARRALTSKIDSVLLHLIFGPVFFVLIMGVLFFAVFWISDPVSAWIDVGEKAASHLITHVFGHNWGTSLVTEGIVAGAGTVLSFLPQVVMLTMALELLEASGYLARGAFVADRVLQWLGLSGRSFVPMLMGHACAVPAITAARIVRDPRERLIAIMVIPLMACSARIPVYGLLISTFFSTYSALARALISFRSMFVGFSQRLSHRGHLGAPCSVVARCLWFWRCRNIACRNCRTSFAKGGSRAADSFEWWVA